MQLLQAADGTSKTGKAAARKPAGVRKEKKEKKADKEKLRRTPIVPSYPQYPQYPQRTAAPFSE
jgi:hypothetical protein